MLQEVMQPFGELMQSGELPQWDTQNLRELTKTLRSLVTMLDERTCRIFHNLLEQTALVHTLAGEHEAFERLISTIDQNLLTSQSRRIYPGNVQHMLHGRLDSAPSLPLARRVAITGSFVRCLTALDAVQLSQRSMRTIVAVKNGSELAQTLQFSRLLNQEELRHEAERIGGTDHGFCLAAVASSYESELGRLLPRPRRLQDDTSRSLEAQAKATQAIATWKQAIRAARSQEHEAIFQTHLSKLYERLDRKANSG